MWLPNWCRRWGQMLRVISSVKLLSLKTLYRHPLYFLHYKSSKFFAIWAQFLIPPPPPATHHVPQLCKNNLFLPTFTGHVIFATVLSCLFFPSANMVPQLHKTNPLSTSTTFTALMVFALGHSFCSSPQPTTVSTHKIQSRTVDVSQ